ncbi:hypothetical protein [Achromobacter sp. AONIH1]|uniref:hypothetical protein n=1 Tax=Achromobacter sp. AONIH1 TaxID=1758194 RepID=UPI0018F81409|nr:hypothetical protein [Achromobacter sp. AONIH1]
MLMTLVVAGYNPSDHDLWRHLDVASRPLASEVPTLTDYLLRRDAEDSEQLPSFVERLQRPRRQVPDKE